MAEHQRFIGRKIDHYKIVSLLGEGGMGWVFKGLDTSLNRPVAIKLMPPQFAARDNAALRFQREARLLAEINHPNIAHIYRTGEMEGCPYYVMEYIEGQSLAEMLAVSGRVAGSRAIRLMMQAAKALQAAADHNIIHRDIKPGNLMVTKDDHLKVVDFGIAKDFDDDSFKTATGTIVGTPQYMSPEQGRGGKVDLRSDIYSLGATFYHMVSGQPPFDADNIFTLIQKHVSEPVRSIAQLNPNVPEGLCRIIYGMLEKNPGDRIQDYNELMIALERASGRKDGFQSYIVHDDRARIPQDAALDADRRKARLILIGAALVVILIVLVAITGNKGTPISSPAARRDEPPVADNRGGRETNSRRDAVTDGLSQIHQLREHQVNQLNQ
ncbi:serine/threonine protein kinase [Candidatus Sumerlaeota bacterium]|nr:serine/threonine protein kinase [Candidatus Sumerlaeota bacterium]